MRFQPFIGPIIGVSIFLGLSYWIAAPAFNHAKNSAQRSICQSNLKTISAALASYTRDSDGKFPPISSGERGWADLLNSQPEKFQCPSGWKTNQTRRSDYFYNARVAGTERSKLKFPLETIVLGDGTDNAGTNSHLSELPFDWRTDENSPAQRHLNGGNYAFVDGHVKFLWPKAISTQPLTRNSKDWKPTFAVR